MNCKRNCYIIRYVTQICCHITLQNLNVHLYNFYMIVIQFKSVTDRLFTVNIYRNVMFWIICLCQLIYCITACVQNICHQHAHMLCIVHAILSVAVSMTRCCNAVTSV